MNDSMIEIIPPASSNDDSPVARARRMAKEAFARAGDTLEAAHREAAISLDEAETGLLPVDNEPMSNASQTADIPSERMVARSLMLAEAFQHAAIVDIASADAAVRHIRTAVGRPRKDPDPV